MLKVMLFIVSIIVVSIVLPLFFALRIPVLSISEDISQSKKLDEIDRWLGRIHKKGKFNGVVLLSKNGKVIFEKSYGANGVNGEKILSEDSSFNLASVSKQFTAMGVVLLKSRSVIDYNEDIARYIPELGFYTGVTIKHLLHHTSGIPDYMKLVMKHRDDESVFTVAEMIELYSDKRPKANFPPGEKFEYSNTGYVLLTDIIEKASGQEFSKFMTENIFMPLGMDNTQVFNLLSNSEPNNRVYGYAHKYWLLGGKKLKKDLNYFDGVVGDGGIYSSARDLALWDAALNEGVLIPTKKYEDAYASGTLSNGSKTGYGFGWVLNGDHTVEHAGGWQGFSSFIYRGLKNQELIVILDNSSNHFRVNSIGFRFNSIGLNLKKAIGEL